jgi:hypothetical protein
VPASAVPALPPHGVLYVFLDLRWGHSNGFRVAYVEDVTVPLAPAPMPADLAAAYGPEARHAWRWTAGLDDPASRCPRLLPKWPFDPLVVAIPSALVAAWRATLDPDQKNPVFWWPDVPAMHQVLLEAQEAGDPPENLTKTEDPPMARPYRDYPQDWRSVEIAAALLLDQVKRRFRYASSDHHLRSVSSEAQTAMQDRIEVEARQWLADAAAQAPFDAPPAPAREAFWAWLQNWEEFSLAIMKDATRLAIEAALVESPAAAARIPAEAINRMRIGHALATRTETGVFAVTPDRMLAPPSYVQGNAEETAETHLLLLELSSNEGLGHYFGEGVYQFWITPDDLRQGRFERVQLTTTAY